MSTLFLMTKNDLLPELTATLQDADGVAVDLSGATGIEFHMVPVGSSTPKVNATAAFVDQANGRVKYSWTGTDTDTAGEFYGEFEVAWGAFTETFPNGEHIVVRIQEELA